MAFTTQQRFTAELDGTTADKLNRKLDRTLNKYEDRLNNVNEILEGTEFFNEYFSEHFEPSVGQSDYLSLDNNVCKTLENYATYLLNSRDIKTKDKTIYKVYYDEKEFQKAINREVLYQEYDTEIIDFLMTNNSNFKKQKTQTITSKDLKDSGELGVVLRDYNTYLTYLSNLDTPNQKFKIDRIKGSVKQDMIHVKDMLKGVHGYNLKYFSESTEPCLDVIDLANPAHLKGFSLESNNPNFRRVDGLLRLNFNGDFQNNFQCILYDLEKLIEKTPLNKKEKEVVNLYKKGLTIIKIADIIGLSRKAVAANLDRAIKKITDKAFELRWR